MLITIAFPLYGADKQFNFDFFQHLPQDLQGKICALVCDTNVNSYPVTQEQKEEYLILPTTTSIHPIRVASSREDLDKDLSVKPNEVCVPHAQCWVKKTPAYRNTLCVRLDNDLKKTQAVYYLPPQANGKSFFDGVNTEGFGFYALQNSEGEIYGTFLKEKTHELLKRCSVDKEWDLLWNGTLRSCTVQHDMNRIFISKDSANKKHVLVIYERDRDRAIGQVGAFESSKAIEKTVCFGNNIFACIKDDNTLNFFSLKNGSITYFLDSPRICFKNIAVNPSFENKNGFRYRFAVQGPVKEDKTADIYVCDLSECYKPTLFYTHTIPNADCVKNFYYEHDEIRVAYHDAENTNLITRIDLYKDNFTALWFGYMMRHYGREKKTQ